MTTTTTMSRKKIRPASALGLMAALALAQPLCVLAQATTTSSVSGDASGALAGERLSEWLLRSPLPPSELAMGLRWRVPAEVEAQRTQGTFERVKAAREAGAASMEDLEQRRFAMLAAQAALEQSQRDVERNEPLASAGGVSKQSFDQMKTKVSQSDAQLTAAKAAVVAARAQVEIGRASCRERV